MTTDDNNKETMARDLARLGYTADEIQKIEQADEKFKTAMVRDLTGRGYTDIEIIGVSASIGRGSAMATINGERVQLRVIVPDNQTAYRRPHFRVKVVN